MLQCGSTYMCMAITSRYTVVVVFFQVSLSSFATVLSDWIGRKKSITVGAAIYGVGGILQTGAVHISLVKDSWGLASFPGLCPALVVGRAWERGYISTVLFVGLLP